MFLISKLASPRVPVPQATQAVGLEAIVVNGSALVFSNKSLHFEQSNVSDTKKSTEKGQNARVITLENELKLFEEDLQSQSPW